MGDEYLYFIQQGLGHDEAEWAAALVAELVEGLTSMEGVVNAAKLDMRP